MKYLFLLVLFLLSGCSRDPEQDDDLPRYVRKGYIYDVTQDAYVPNLGTISSPTKYDENWGDLASTREDLRCLASNIYWEARGVSLDDQVAVAAVTLNRYLSGKYAPTLCGVVFQEAQFSWTRNTKLGLEKIDRKAWHVALMVARAVLAGDVGDNTHGATNYYNPKEVHPAWARSGYDIVRMKGHTYMKLAKY